MFLYHNQQKKDHWRGCITKKDKMKGRKKNSNEERVIMGGIPGVNTILALVFFDFFANNFFNS